MFSNVLIGVDGQAGGHDAVALATQLAAADARLTYAHVYGYSTFGGEALIALEHQDAHRLLERERDAAARDVGLLAHPASSVGRGLHELADRHHADLLVVGSTRHGLIGRVLMGDDTRASLNAAPCAVAIAPSGYATSSHPLAKLGVGYDGSVEGERALTVARDFAARDGSSVSVRSVVSLQSLPYGEPTPANHWPEVVRQLTHDDQQRINALDGVHGEASYGDPGEELARFSDEVDLLIVGSRGYGPLGRLIHGSTSNHLVRYAHCPLLILTRAGAAAGAEILDASRPESAIAPSKPQERRRVTDAFDRRYPPHQADRDDGCAGAQSRRSFVQAVKLPSYGRETEHLRVLIASEGKDRLAVMASIVVALGHEVIAREIDVQDVGPVTARERPDVALVGLGESSEHALGLIDKIVHEAACPVIVLLHEPDQEFVQEASKRGVFAHVTEDDIEDWQSSIDITLRRFAEYHDLEGAFGRRAMIERAKGILMERHAIDEGEAFELLREKSRVTNRKLIDLATAVVDGHSLLPGHTPDQS